MANNLPYHIHGLKRYYLLLSILFIGITFNVSAGTNPHVREVNPEASISIAACDNVTNGGAIGFDEMGCPNPVFDPAKIVNVTLPTGGTGALEYVWIYTTGDPNAPISQWTPIPNTNSPEYDPGPITQTTYFRRCSRRAGCVDYIGETNIVMKEVACCNPITNPGKIGFNKSHCGTWVKPDTIFNTELPSGGSGALEYIWLKSTVGPPIGPGTWDTVKNAKSAFLAPDTVKQTCYFVRLARRHGCNDYQASNIVVYTINSNPSNITGVITNVSCHGGNDGAINITVGGGKPPYKYDWNNNAPDVEDPTNLIANNYTVIVTDSVGCTGTATFAVKEPTPLVLAGTAQNPVCNAQASGSINITVSGGTPPYTYDWDNAPDVEDPINLLAGTYNVTVTDSKGCKVNKTFILLDPPAIVVNGTTTNVNCFGGSNGSITITVTNGTGPFTYDWDNAPDVQNPTGLSAGTYTVIVTDSKGCKGTKSFTITQPTQLVVQTAVTPPTCFGFQNGSITTTVSGGTPNYFYNWDNLPDVQNPGNVGAGNYNLTVTDSKGCTATTSVTVTQPTAVNVTGTANSVSCFQGNDGSVNITATGGTTPYVYLWSNGSGQEDISGLTAGNYSVTVTDAKGCTKIASFTVTQPQTIIVTGATTNVTCNGGSNGSINLTVNGGTPPYSFDWDNAPDVEDPSGLPAGTYNVTVTDSKGCKTNKQFTITAPPALSVSATGSNPTCFNGNNGSISSTVSGGTAPYTFNWDNAPDVQNPSGLTAGNYSLTVTDSKGCTGTATVTLTQPTELFVSGTSQNVTCFQGSNGSVTLSVNGGTPSYIYKWSNNSTQQNLSNVTAGTYQVTVTDSKGCSKTASFTINQPTQVSVSGTTVNVSCKNGNDGSINLTVSGGTPGYTYNWDNAPDVEDPTGLTAGTYNVTVSDANGCTKTASFTITQPSEISITGSTTPVKCNGGSNGSINITVTGGTPGYTYNWDNAPDVEDPTGLAAGNYTVVVTDSKGCTKSASFTISQPTQIQLNATAVDPTCNGAKNGSITTTVSGGTAPYSYNWDNLPDVPNPTNVGAGTYTVTVTDANQCTATKTVVVSEPSAISLSGTTTQVSCNKGKDGSITLTVSGGTPGYTFNWSNGSSSQNLTNIGAGNYNVVVTDSKGCTKTASFTITEPTDISLSGTTTNVSCNGGSDGSINLTVNGGTAPYSFDWNNAPDVEDPTGLAAGNYSVVVTDSKGCTKTAQFTITQPTGINITGSSSDVSCNGGNNGSINITVSGGTPGYTYNWDNAPDVEDPSGLTAGTYTVIVSDSKGCTKTATFTINQPTQLSVSTQVTHPGCNGASTGSITTTVTGGTPNYTFNWNNLPDVQNPTNVAAGTYSLTVTDSKGCTATTSVTVTQPTPLVLTLNPTNVSCSGGNDGSIDLTASGGTSPYIYKWSNNSTNEDLTGIAAGNYSVTVTDANGCTKTGSTTINQPTPVNITGTTNPVSCSGGNDGSINITVSGGTPGYTYNWDNAPDVEDPSGLAAGTYCVTVTDAKGCTTTKCFTISSNPALNITGTTSPYNCANGQGGSINITVSGGTPVYTYNWDNAPDVEDPSNLQPGSYTVVVTDSKGCTKSATFTVDKTSNMVVNLTPTPTKCNGSSDGSISTTVVGGTGPFTYDWDNAPDVQNPSGLAAGTYTVVVTDKNGCTGTASTTITSPPIITISAIPSDPKCNGSNDGSIVTTVVGGTSPYSFDWDNAPDVQNPTGLGAGSYTVTVSDKNNCKQVASVVLNQPTQLEVNGTTKNVSCFGTKTGSIDLSVSGGTSPYFYNWQSLPASQDQNNLGAGTYQVTVTDSKGCTKTASFTITQPNELTLSSSVQNVNCPGGKDGAINLTVNGGTSPYLYNWDNAPDVEDPTGLTKGSYCVTVTDANGCTKTLCAPINELPGMVITGSVKNVDCAGGNNGSISITVSGGNPTFSYDWDNAPDVQNPTGLGAGTYSVTVTDSKGCTATKSFTVAPGGTINISGNVTNVKCNGGNSGSIALNVTGGNAPYSYNWDNAPDVSNPTGLTAGTYQVTVTDSKGCQAVQSFVVSQPDPITITLTMISPMCVGAKNGSINTLVVGGVGLYTYNWDNAPDVQNPSGLGAGSYTVIVTDANGCTASKTEQLTDPQPLNITASQIAPDCDGGNNGKIDLTITGGSSPYFFNWSGNLQDVEDPMNVPTGTYTVTVTDNKGCTATKTVVVPAGGKIVCTSTITHVKCFDGNDGSITLNVSGGMAPYTFDWDNAPDVQNPTGLKAGIYNVTITDTKGCTKTATMIITAPSQIVVTGNVKNVSCFGGNDGAINITVTGGTPPYTFLWDNNQPAQEDLINLKAGLYKLKVTDNHNCMVFYEFQVTQPDKLDLTVNVTNVDCYGSNSGKIDLTVTGGTPNYTYNWDNAPDVQDPSNLGPGTYTVTVTDAKGCTGTISATITESPELKVTGSVKDVTCFGGNDGSINLTVTGGMPPYNYDWNNAPDVEDPSGLTAGTYKVSVTDSKGCVKTATFTVGTPTPINPKLSAVPVSCTDAKDGTVSVTVTGGSGSYSYKWSDPNGSTGATVNNLAPGVYTVTVTDSKGCTASGQVTLPNSPNACKFKIGDYVWLDSNQDGIQDANEVGFNGIIVKLKSAGPDGNFNTNDDVMVAMDTTDYDSNGKKGYYLFNNILAGTYQVCFMIDTAFYKFTKKDQGGNDNKDSDVNASTMCTDPFSVNLSTGDNLTIDAGVSLKCDNITYGGLIGNNQSHCGSNVKADIITSLANASGGAGDIEYLWLKSTTNPTYYPGSPGWTPIPNSNAPSYDPGVLNQTTYYVRCARRAGCDNYPGESNTVTIEIKPVPTAQIKTSPSGPICVNNQLTYWEAVDNGGFYEWDFGPGANPQVIYTKVASNVKWTTTGMKAVKLTVTNNGCSASVTKMVQVVNCYNNPIDNFTAKLNNEGFVELDWTTQLVDHSHIYQIERSTNDGVDYFAIGSVDGNTLKTHYQFVDKNPTFGDNTYRIKFVDLISPVQFSEKRLIMLEQSEVDFFLSPNPFVDKVTLEFYKKVEFQDNRLFMTDVSGRIMLDFTIEKGIRTFTLDLSLIPSGTYFITYQEKGRAKTTQKIVKR